MQLLEFAESVKAQHPCRSLFDGNLTLGSRAALLERLERRELAELFGKNALTTVAMVAVGIPAKSPSSRLDPDYLKPACVEVDWLMLCTGRICKCQSSICSFQKLEIKQGERANFNFICEVPV